MRARVAPEYPRHVVFDDGTVYGPSGKRLKVTLDGRGYLQVSSGRRGSQIRVHRLVATAFYGPQPFEGAQVRHLDGDKSNNRADNLAWGTAVQNQADRVAHGTDSRGVRSSAAKLTEAQVLDIRRRHAVEGESLRSLGSEFGVDESSIGKIVHRKTWRHL